MMKRWVALVVVWMMACVSAWGQATGQISGTVRDQSGAVLPGVEVTVTQTETGLVRSAVTNETGSYGLANLALGPYRLEAALPGFRTYVQTGILLQVGSNPVINPQLEVGQVTETIEVQADAARVETRNTSVGTVVENQQILEMPLNGRAATDLITLSGAAVSLGGETLGGRYVAGAPRLQIAGVPMFAVTYLLDGSTYYNFFAVSSLPMPFPDALEEFKVQSSGVGTTDSRAAGVSAVTKSGTNVFHGDAFEFLRNDLFNARQYFATTNSTLKRNQFGGTLGGPILKGKLFFFGGLQETIVRANPSNLQAFIPTDAMLAGDWTAYGSAACVAGGRPLALQAPWVNNRIDPTQFSPVAVQMVKRVRESAPPPDPCGLVTYGNPQHQNTWQSVSRVDYQWNPKQSVFGRYMIMQDHQAHGTEINPNLLNSTVEGGNIRVQAFNIGDTYLISGTTVNAFRASFTRSRAHETGPSFFNLCDVGVTNYWCGGANPTPRATFSRILLSVSGGFNLGTGHTVGDKHWSQNIEIRDDLNLVRGTHQLNFGGSVSFNRAYETDNFYTSGRWQFSGGGAALPGLAQLMLGTASQMTQGANYDFYADRQVFPVLYASDTWKLTQRLTLVGGLRWEPFFPVVLSAPGTAHNFDVNRFLAGQRSTLYPTAPAGWLFGGDPGTPGLSTAYNQWKKFAPRAGLAWDVNGDGKTSIRASYGLSYSVVGGGWYDVSAEDPPCGCALTQLNVSFSNPWQTYPGGNPFPKTKPLFPAFAFWNDVPLHQKQPYSQTWNLAVQKQIGGWVTSATYLGSATRHQWFGRQLNPSVIVPGPIVASGCAATATNCNAVANSDARRVLNLNNGGQFGAITGLDDGGNATYNGFLLSAEHRFAKGFSLQANYTLSRCITDAEVTGTTGVLSTYSNPYSRLADRGNCAADRRNLFNLISVAQTPKFANRTLHAIAGGWQLAPILRIASGAPLNILAGADRALNGGANSNNGFTQRAQQVQVNAYGPNTGGFRQWLDPAAFIQPALGTYGNVGYDSLVAPRNWGLDVALSRRFDVRESQRVEVRFEAFNVTNSFIPGLPAIGVTNPGTFGQIRSAGNPRIMQFAMKYVF
jgi:carboxypeptidase family protein